MRDAEAILPRAFAKAHFAGWREFAERMPPPKIYHVHPLVAGPISEWPRHLARVRAMGFDHIGSAPLFAPGEAGDVFLTADPESLHPALGVAGPADDGIARLCEACAAQWPGPGPGRRG